MREKKRGSNCGNLLPNHSSRYPLESNPSFFLETITTDIDPTKTETLEYLRAALGIRVMSTYGRTETAGTVTSRSMFDYSNSAHLGSPVSCNEIKLVDDKIGGYKSMDEPNPRGEVRGSLNHSE